MANAASAPITIKKYANRRLYNTATSSYVTLDNLCQMVKANEEFVVYDAKTGEDITRSVLTQIIVEEEAKNGQNLLPISFLRQLIGFYGDSLAGLVPRYLDYSMRTFHTNENQMRQYMQQAIDGLFPFNPMEEVAKKNMALFDSAMKMFGSFYGAESGSAEAAPPATPAPAAPAASANDMAEMQSKLDQMQKQLAELAKKK